MAGRLAPRRLTVMCGTPEVRDCATTMPRPPMGSLQSLTMRHLSRVLSHLLYGSAEADWVFFAAAASVIACVALGASLVPARRAAAVEPIVALRQE
jgi:hypothetical protein